MNTFARPDAFATNTTRRLNRFQLRGQTFARFQTTTRRPWCSAFCLIALMAVLIRPSHAAQRIFTGAGVTASIEDSGNYTDGIVPANDTTTDELQISASAAKAPVLTQDRSLAKLTFLNATNATATSNSLTSNASSPNGPFTLTLGVGGIDAAALTTNGTDSIGSTTPANAVNIVLPTAATAIVVSGSGALGVGTLTLPNIVSGAGGFTKTGSGTLALTNGSNSYSGGTTVSRGIVSFVSGALGTTGTINVAGNSSTGTPAAPSGVLQYAPDNTDDISGRLAATGGLAIIDTNGNNVVFNTTNGLSGSGQLRKLGLGTLELRAANNLTGTVGIGTTAVGFNGGNLLVTNNGALGSTSTSLSLLSNGPSGGITGNGTLQVGNSVTIPNPLSIAARSLTTGGIAVQSVSGSNSLTGNLAITNTTGAGATLQADAGSTLTLNTLSGTASAPKTYLLTGAGTGVVSGIISTSNLSVTKSGAGTWTLSGNNTYTGATAINAGTLLINGTQTTATGAVTVANGATLGGSGTIGGATTINSGGVHAPGLSPGIQTINGAYNMAGTLQVELGGTSPATIPGTGYDQVRAGGAGNSNLTLSGSITVTPVNSFAPAAGNTFVIVVNTGSGTTTVTSAAPSGFLLQAVEYDPASNTITNSSSGNDVALAPINTSVNLIAFESKQFSDGMWVQWRTGLETNNVGFVLLRQDWMQGKNGRMQWSRSYRLHPSLIAGAAAQGYANADAAGGFGYGWKDVRPLPKSLKVRYILVDVDGNNKTKLHGPAVPVPAQGSLGSRTSSKLLTQLGQR